MLKWLAIITALGAAGFVGMWLYGYWVMNPNVTNELTSDPNGVKSQKVMLLKLSDGTELPVNYLREGDKVFAGADGLWWRSLSESGKVVVTIKGEQMAGVATTVRDDPAYRREVFSRLRPNALPAWLPEWIGGVLVVIDLEMDNH